MPASYSYFCDGHSYVVVSVVDHHHAVPYAIHCLLYVYQLVELSLDQMAHEELVGYDWKMTIDHCDLCCLISICSFVIFHPSFNLFAYDVNEVEATINSREYVSGYFEACLYHHRVGVGGGERNSATTAVFTIVRSRSGHSTSTQSILCKSHSDFSRLP